MIDHVTLAASDLLRARGFYEKALAPLGYVVVMAFPGSVGFGRDGKPDFWLKEGKVGDGVHVAVRAGSRGEVDAFYEAALGAGGKDNGGPGLRAHYHPHYYGAFVLDDDGNNVEAVVHGSEGD